MSFPGVLVFNVRQLVGMRRRFIRLWRILHVEDAACGAVQGCGVGQNTRI